MLEVSRMKYRVDAAAEPRGGTRKRERANEAASPRRWCARDVVAREVDN